MYVTCLEFRLCHRMLVLYFLKPAFGRLPFETRYSFLCLCTCLEFLLSSHACFVFLKPAFGRLPLKMKYLFLCLCTCLEFLLLSPHTCSVFVEAGLRPAFFQSEFFLFFMSVYLSGVSPLVPESLFCIFEAGLRPASL